MTTVSALTHVIRFLENWPRLGKKDVFSSGVISGYHLDFVSLPTTMNKNKPFDTCSGETASEVFVLG